MLISADQALILPIDQRGPELPAEDDIRLRRALLQAAADHALPQDLIDAADLALSLGLEDVAARLFSAAALQGGFGPQILAVLDRANANTELWGAIPRQESATAAGFVVDRAIADLRQLMAARPTLQPLPEDWSAFLPADIDLGPPPLGRDIAKLRAQAERIAGELRQIIGLEVAERASRIRDLMDELVMLEPVHLSDHVGADIAAFADMFVLERARAFISMHIDLLRAEPASLLVDAGAQQFGVLGPYFSNVPIILRTAADIFALIDAATAEKARPEDVETWVVLLSIHLRQHEVNDLVEELGDRGMVRALGALLLRLVRRGTFWRWDVTVRKMRDVLLDIGAYEPAAIAQHIHALWYRTNINEWKILGQVRATNGEIPGAKEAYNRVLLLDPQDQYAQLQLVALDEGRPVIVTGGYETPPGRQRLRLARMKAYKALS